MRINFSGLREFKVSQLKLKNIKLKIETGQFSATDAWNLAIFQRNCRGQFKYMKCALNHRTDLCKKPKSTLAKCVNCGGPHTSANKNCKKRVQLNQKICAGSKSQKTWGKVTALPVVSLKKIQKEGKSKKNLERKAKGILSLYLQSQRPLEMMLRKCWPRKSGS